MSGPRNLLAQFPVAKLRVNLAVTTLSTAAWTELLSATTKGCTAMTVHYTGEGILKLSQGALSEEDANELVFYVPPGGLLELVPVEIAKGKRLSAKCLDQNVSQGELVINFFG